MLPELKKALASKVKALRAWENLTPLAQRDFTRWVTSAKQSETRTRRIERTCDMLAEGKRRPCCYAVVPMPLYKRLGELPKAKEQWKHLTPDERRDFVDWIESVKETMRKERIEKVCRLLAAGKRHP